MQLYFLQTLQKKCTIANLTPNLYSKLKTSICLTNSKTVILFILYITNNYKYAHSKLNSQFITSEKNENMYLAFPDGSCNNNTENLKAGYEVYFGPNNPLNTYARTRNAQTVNNSEIQGVEYILTVFLLNKNLTIYTDSAFVINNIKRFTKSNSSKIKRETMYKDIIIRITNIINMRKKYNCVTKIKKV